MKMTLQETEIITYAGVLFSLHKWAALEIVA